MNRSYSYDDVLLVPQYSDIESRKEITDNVLEALSVIDTDRRELIRNSAPPSLRKSFETFGGVPGTPIFSALETGKIGYFRYLLSKP